jgi:DNA-binding beta-propeller fold protein YncE
MRVCRGLCVLLLAGAASGCGSAAAHHAAASAARQAHVSNPFKVVARYSASSLALKNPRDLAIGPNGNLYVTDATDRVTVVSPEGKVLRRWGKKGSGQGEFHFVPNDPRDPTGLQASIAVGPDGKVYVSDSGNSRVEVFSSTGRFLRQIGSFGYNNGQLQAPLSVAADGEGDVYVADDQAETLSKFSASGHFQWSIGGPGSADPDLLGHFGGLSVDPHNRLVAAVQDAHTVVYIDAAGHKVDAFSTHGDFHDDWGPCGTTATPTGATVVTSCPGPPTGRNAHVYYRATLVFDRTHRLVGAWYHTPFAVNGPPQFGAHGEAFSLATDGALLRLQVAIPSG